MNDGHKMYIGMSDHGVLKVLNLSKERFTFERCQ